MEGRVKFRRQPSLMTGSQAELRRKAWLELRRKKFLRYCTNIYFNRMISVEQGSFEQYFLLKKLQNMYQCSIHYSIPFTYQKVLKCSKIFGVQLQNCIHFFSSEKFEFKYFCKLKRYVTQRYRIFNTNRNFMNFHKDEGAIDNTKHAIHLTFLKFAVECTCKIANNRLLRFSYLFIYLFENLYTGHWPFH